MTSPFLGRIRTTLLGLRWSEEESAFLSPDREWCVMFEGEFRGCPKWKLCQEKDYERLVEIAWGTTRDELLEALEEHGLMPVPENGCDILEYAKECGE